MMGAFADFERNIIRKRQVEDIAKAKAKALGVYAKRGASINKEEIQKLQAEGLTITAKASAINISRMSVYRINKQN